MKEIKRVLTLRQAVLDIKNGQSFYDEIEIGVGQYFKSSILTEIDSLILFAGIHPVRYGFYCMLCKRFPFAIYYDVDQDEAKVVAVLDMRMNPDTIQKTLKQR